MHRNSKRSLSSGLTLAFVAVALLNSSASAKSASDCQALWKSAAGDTATMLPADTGARYYAALRVSGKTIDDGKLSKADFMADCEKGVFDPRAAEAGAPFKGANSFTEGQARDRAVWFGYSDVSKLEKDSDGIWRGAAKFEGKDAKLAIDFKGNVVAQ